MTALDLHPEELLERMVSQEITPDEQARLDEHLAQCDVCRFELQARRDFLDAPTAGLAVDDLVSRAMAGLPTAEPTPLRRRFSARQVRTMLAVAVLTTAMFSFAATNDGVRVALKQLLAVVVPSLAPAPEPEPVTVRTPAPAPTPVRAAAEVVAEPTAPVAEEPAVAVDEVPVAVAAAPVHVPLHAPTPVVAPRRDEVATPAIPAAPVETAASLFSSANVARSTGHHDDALRLYRDLGARFPASAEARVAHALAGRLLLDSGDARAALGELDAYLRSGDDSLTEETLAARALAFGRLGQLADERAAWAALVAAYPDGVHAGRARQRLSELGGR